MKMQLTVGNTQDVQHVLSLLHDVKVMQTCAKINSRQWVRGGKLTSAMDFRLLTHLELALWPHPRLTDMPLPVPRGITAAGGCGCMPISLHHTPLALLCPHKKPVTAGQTQSLCLTQIQHVTDESEAYIKATCSVAFPWWAEASWRCPA